MSDNAELGMKPQDPADQAGVGGGVVPDDQAEGYEQAAELARKQGERDKPSDDATSGD